MKLNATEEQELRDMALDTMRVLFGMVQKPLVEDDDPRQVLIAANELREYLLYVGNAVDGWAWGKQA